MGLGRFISRPPRTPLPTPSQESPDLLSWGLYHKRGGSVKFLPPSKAVGMGSRREIS